MAWTTDTDCWLHWQHQRLIKTDGYLHWWHGRLAQILTANTGSTSDWCKYWLVANTSGMDDRNKYWLPALAAPTTDTTTDGFQHLCHGWQTQILIAHTGSSHDWYRSWRLPTLEAWTTNTNTDCHYWQHPRLIRAALMTDPNTDCQHWGMDDRCKYWLHTLAAAPSDINTDWLSILAASTTDTNTDVYQHWWHNDRHKYWLPTLAAPTTGTNTDCQHWWHGWLTQILTGSTNEWYKYWAVCAASVGNL